MRITQFLLLATASVTADDYGYNHFPTTFFCVFGLISMLILLENNTIHCKISVFFYISLHNKGMLIVSCTLQLVSMVARTIR